MAKYALIYRGGGGMPETPEEQQRLMAAWGAWFGSLGEGVVDPGAPFGEATTVPAGTAPLALSGYSIVQAGDLAAAAAIAGGCPVLANGGSVDVVECVQIEM